MITKLDINGPLEGDLLADGISMRLIKDYVVEARDKHIIVPSGFITDFASIPRWLWSIIAPHGKYSDSTAVHDFLYSTAVFERKLCDQIFYDLSIAGTLSKTESALMYSGIRMFGAGHYAKA